MLTSENCLKAASQAQLVAPVAAELLPGRFRGGCAPQQELAALGVVAAFHAHCHAHARLERFVDEHFFLAADVHEGPGALVRAWARARWLVYCDTLAKRATVQLDERGKSFDDRKWKLLTMKPKQQ